MIKNRVFVVGSPTRTGDVIDFDLDHLLDAVDDARDAHLLFRHGRGTGLWLLWHLVVLAFVVAQIVNLRRPEKYAS
jgi:hypothetical protein